MLDADALNILATHSEMLSMLPAGSILTPHPGEFQRLVGRWENDFEKLELLRKLCTTYQINVVLKGAFSVVCDQKGVITFNPTGNPGMATAGSGDVLTGIVSSLLAQGYSPIDGLRLGVFLHGLSGDLAVMDKGEHSLVASDLIEYLSRAFLHMNDG